MAELREIGLHEFDAYKVVHPNSLPDWKALFDEVRWTVQEGKFRGARALLCKRLLVLEDLKLGPTVTLPFNPEDPPPCDD